MADETTTRIFDVRVTGSDALDMLTKLRLQAAALREQQRELGKVTEENAKEYYELDSQIKAVNQQATAYQRQVTNSIKLQNQQEKSLERLRTQLSLDNAELVRYGKETENQARKAELQERIAATTAEIKRQEEALGDHRRSVGDYRKAVLELRTEITDITNQLVAMAAAGDTSSDTYKVLVQRAGELREAQARVNNEIRLATQGTETLRALTQAASGVTGVYGLWTTASSLLGTQNKELDDIFKRMITTITALNSLTAISNTLSRTSASYRAAENVLQKIGINQTFAETKAITAKNTALTASTVGQKAAATATWLWNAALSANPVVILTVGIAALTVGVLALTGAFRGNTDEAEAATRALEAYRRGVETTNEVLSQLETRRNTQSKEEEIRGKRELAQLRQNGATQQQLAEAQIKNANRLREIEIATARQRRINYEQDFENVKRAISAKELEIQTWDKSSKKLKQVQKDLQDLRGEYTRLFQAIENEAYVVANTTLDILNANIDAQKAAADRAYEIALRNSERLEALRIAKERFDNTYIKNDILAQQQFQRGVFNIQQKGQEERLELQRRAGKITQAEYESQLKLLSLQSSQFVENQANDLNTYFDNVRKNLIKQAGATVDEQIAEVVKAYNKAAKELSTIQAPVRIAGMSDEEYARLLSEYEAFVYEQAELAKRLEKKMQDDILAIREASLAKRLSEINKNLDREYKNDLDKFMDNERERLRVQAEMLQKQIEQHREAGADTNALEAQLRANNLARLQLDLNKELREAEKSARKRYEARKKYLQEELKLVEGNAEREAEIRKELDDLEEEFLNDRLDKIVDYANAVREIYEGISDLLTALGNRRIQEVELQYTAESEALSERYAKGLITEAEYNNQQLKLENQKQKEIAKIERQNAIRERASNIFSVVTDTAAGIVKAVRASPLTFGLPWSAFVATTGALQLATILAEPLPKAARGAYVGGLTHAQGGSTWELERGETVINARSSSMFLPLLSAINEIGGGVPFVEPFSDGGYSVRSSLAANNFTANDMKAAIREAFSAVNIAVAVEDIRNAEQEYAVVQGAGSIFTRD